jgi:hypothetical protein
MFFPVVSGGFVFGAARDYRLSCQDLLAPPLGFRSIEKALLRFADL